MKVESFCSLGLNGKNRDFIEIELSLAEARKLTDGRSKNKVIEEIITLIKEELEKDYNADCD